VQPGAERVADARDARATLDPLHLVAVLEHHDRRHILYVEVLGELRSAVHVDARTREGLVVPPFLQHLIEKCLDTTAEAGPGRMEVQQFGLCRRIHAVVLPGCGEPKTSRPKCLAVWPLRGGGGPHVSTSTESYSALMVRLRPLDGSVMTPDEAQRIRDAADARLFGDPDQIEISTAALDLLEGLVEAARLSSRTSSALAEMLSEIESVGATS